MPIRQAPLTAAILLLIAPVTQADDWPMWRKDSGRTAATTSLPKSLWPRWVRDLPPLTPAFHNQRLRFDAGYEPVIADGRLLLASSRTDSVTAYDADTGAQLWSFHTNGPVRFAPAVSEGRVCFGSDDGWLYCVDLTNGSLKWRYRVVPSDRRLLGNRRLISVWPVRGGPVIADGTVYFAAGVWPFEGVFVAALNVKTGAEVWRNDRLGYLFGQQPHNTEAIGGVAPQGYLVVHGDSLIVPCSTAYPATLNRQTGELIEFELPGPGRLPGGWFAAIDETSARAIRRGKLTFDDVINRQQHEDKVHKGRGVSGLSRRVLAGDDLLEFDRGFPGVEGTVHSMAIADNRLYVSTREGKLYCFGERDDETSETIRLQRKPAPLTVSPAGAARVAALCRTLGGERGFAVVAGIRDGDLVRALVRHSRFHVIAIDSDLQRLAVLREQLVRAEAYGTRAVVLHADLAKLNLPPYIASLMTTEDPERMEGHWQKLLQSLRPFGGIAATGIDRNHQRLALIAPEPGSFELEDTGTGSVVRRVGPLPGSTDYRGNWSGSPDELVRFPLGVLWFDDTLSHFKRSPQPKFYGGVMTSRPKDWHASRENNPSHKVDYPLLPTVLSDIYTGRVFDDSEHQALRQSLPGATTAPEPSQYRPPRQGDAWKPEQPVVGERTNPLTLYKERRTFPKTYGCDGGVDYGAFYTLRAGTSAFYDKTLESGTVFLSGPRSGCTNSIIPSGGLLNVPYFFEGCTCSYPLPCAMALYALPESHEQWSAWGPTALIPRTIQRIGLNFGAPGDRMTRDGTLWLDYPSVGGPSPKVRVEATGNLRYRYHHSLRMRETPDQPWVHASMVEGLRSIVVRDLKPGLYRVRAYFADPDSPSVGRRVQTVTLQGGEVLTGFDILDVAGGRMRGVVRKFEQVVVGEAGTLEMKLEATAGSTILSGLELIRDSEK